jgi:hypothetical protein
MSDVFKCPGEGVSDIEGCENAGLGSGCKNLKSCPVYAYNKEIEMKRWKA